MFRTVQRESSGVGGGAVRILPGTGWGTARSAVEGVGTSLGTPSTMLRMVPLPVPGRIE